jgi:hypothetical protein
MKKTVLVFTIIFVSLFLVNSTTSIENRQTDLYDPWLDLNDDGEIDIFDVVMVARAYGSSGKPFNKTAAIIELQAKVSVLEATITARLPPVDFLSIPAAAFTSEGESPENQKRMNLGSSISMLEEEYIPSYGTFYAPVQLPSGVTITRLTSYWWDNGPNLVECELSRRIFGGPYKELMATVNSPLASGPGYGVTSDFTINNATIDNQYQYYIELTLPPRPDGFSNDYGFFYALILYEYPP